MGLLEHLRPAIVMIVLFIQRRPQGLFALKGRSADA